MLPSATSDLYYVKPGHLRLPSRPKHPENPTVTAQEPAASPALPASPPAAAAKAVGKLRGGSEQNDAFGNRDAWM